MLSESNTQFMANSKSEKGNNGKIDGSGRALYNCLDGPGLDYYIYSRINLQFSP
jgi:hypothetical protein